ncbi:SURF1 family protein [Agaribacterium sp. ZY112]|uniref:SURF1 family protein n=1 Tax=Agaribacterium sp. ZY112 TaxID=3233574 RepID=UPI003526858C
MTATIGFNIKWKLTAFAGFFLPILISLGFWQLERAKVESYLSTQLQIQQGQEAMPISSVLAELYTKTKDQLQFQPVTASGSYMSNYYWLKEGRTIKGAKGFHVLMPMQLGNGPVVLVDRGWIAENKGQAIPFQTPTMSLKLMGYIDIPVETTNFQSQEKNQSTWPKYINDIDMKKMSAQLGKTIVPTMLVLNSDQNSAFIPAPNELTLNPARHRVYAAQWFALAMLLIVGWFYTNLGRQVADDKRA